MAAINNDWLEALQGEFKKPYYKKLRAFLANEYKTRVIYPDMYHIFEALRLTAYKDVRVVILGQDPYHDDGQAHGLAFSVRDGVRFPPSLRNIFKELNADLNLPMPESGSLIRWAEQGVLLLNTVLTVRAHQAGSHRKHGWENFTDAVISRLNEQREHLVFVLWGAPAQTKLPLIDRTRHAVIYSAHPSPLSAHRGFFRSRPFSQINAYLKTHSLPEIDWNLSRTGTPDLFQ